MEELQSTIQRIIEKLNVPVSLMSLVYISVASSVDLQWPVPKSREDGPLPTYNTSVYKT
jgi:hypothetical protein